MKIQSYSILRTLALVGLLTLLSTLATSPAHAATPAGFALQFTAHNHILGFQNDGVTIAAMNHALHVEFVNANNIQPQASTPASSNNQAAALEAVTWRNLWHGITLTYRATANSIVESVYALDAGASAEQIRLRYNTRVQLNGDGSLTLNFQAGQMNESAPIAWQDIAGARVPVQIAFQIREASAQQSEIGFALGAYDPAYPLLIDPTLSWNNFFGVSDNDMMDGIAVDPMGNVYVIGWSMAGWGTPIRAFSAGGLDAYVAKLNSSGTLLWNTFLGGTGDDSGEDISVDQNGNVFVTGRSGVSWGSPVNALSSPNDIFVAKLNTNGALQWNTFLGGSGDEFMSKILVDIFGNIFVLGASSASWGAPIRPYAGGIECFVAKLNSSGALQWNTFLGSAQDDYATGVVTDANGNIYVAGFSVATWGSPVRLFAGGIDGFVAKLNALGTLQWNTFLGSAADDQIRSLAMDTSANLLVVGDSGATWGTPVSSFKGSTDAFAAKLNSSGALVWNTFMGSGAGVDYGYDVAADSSGNVYLTGRSALSWGTPVRPYSSGGDMLAVKLNSNGILQWNTFLGGDGFDSGYGIAIDTSGNVLISGTSTATWGSPVQAYTGGRDGLVVKLNTNGALQWNTFHGQAGSDAALGIALDANGNSYVTGRSPGAWGSPVRSYASGQDAFVVKFNANGNQQWNTFLGGAGSDAGNAITVDASGHVYVTGNSTATWGGAPMRAYSAGYDAFVARLDATSGALQWNTFLGGASTDYGNGIALDNSNNVFIAGSSAATWGTPAEAYTGGWDAYVAKLDTNGALQWHSFLGSANADTGNGIVVRLTLVYVTGSSSATWGAPVRAYSGGQDAFVAVLNAVNGSVTWNTFLGGAGTDSGDSIALDKNGDCYVTGTSNATWGASPKRAYSAGTDAFVAKLVGVGVFQWHTFLGGSGTDDSRGIAIDTTHGVVYVVGNTDTSWGTPSLLAYGVINVSVAQLDLNGNLQGNFLLGGYDLNDGNAIAADAWNVYTVGASNYGWGNSPSFPSSWEGFVAKIQTQIPPVFLPMIIKSP